MAYRNAVSFDPLCRVDCSASWSLLSEQFHRLFLNWYSHSTRPCFVPKGTDPTLSGHLSQIFCCCSTSPGIAWQTSLALCSASVSMEGWSLGSKDEDPRRVKCVHAAENPVTASNPQVQTQRNVNIFMLFCSSQLVPASPATLAKLVPSLSSFSLCTTLIKYHFDTCQLHF